MGRRLPASNLNYIQLPANTVMGPLNGASAVSIHVWYQPDSPSNPSAIVFAEIATGVGGLILGTSGTGPYNVRCIARSTSGDAERTVTSATAPITNGQLFSIGAVVDYANDAIRLYVNGVQTDNGAATFGSETLSVAGSSDPDFLGRMDINGRRASGNLSHVAIWNRDIGTDAFAALAAGYHAELAAASGLMHLWLEGESLVNHYGSGGTATIVGTVNAVEDPPIIYPAGVLDVVQGSGTPPGSILTPYYYQNLLAGAA